MVEGRRRRLVPRIGLAGLALLAFAAFASPVALAAEPAPDPDAACAKQSTFKSIDGLHKANLTIINQTSSPVKAIWLDYTGKKVFYTNVAPHSQYVQPTWLTHPWIIAGLDGTCYRLVVVNALQQAVSVTPGAGQPPVSTPPPPATLPPVATLQPVATLPGVETPQPVPTLAPVPSSTGAGDFPILPILGGLAAMLAVIGVLAATGRLPLQSGGGTSAAELALDEPAMNMDRAVGFDTVQQTVGSIMGAAGNSLFTDISKAMSSVTPPTGGGGSGESGLSLPPMLGGDASPGVDMTQAVGMDTIRQMVDSHMASASDTVVSDIMQKLTSGTNMDRAVGFDTVQQAVGSIMGAAGNSLFTDISKAMSSLTAPTGGGGSGGESGLSLPPMLGGDASPGVDMTQAVGMDTIRQMVNSHMASASDTVVSDIMQKLSGLTPPAANP